MKYVISDIHGEYDLFLQLLDKIHFNEQDTLYICGDMIEKGKYSTKVLSYVYHHSNMKCILGNHEHEFLKYYHYLKKTYSSKEEILISIKQYFESEEVTIELIEWLSTLPYYIEEKEFICVHAGVPLDKYQHIYPLNEVSIEEFIYDRDFKEPEMIPINSPCVFFGHTPTNTIIQEPKIIAYKRDHSLDNKIQNYSKVHLDLGTWMTHVLGCFCIDTCLCHYVKEKSKGAKSI